MNGLVGEGFVDVPLLDGEEEETDERLGVRDLLVVGIRDVVFVDGVLDVALVVGVLGLVILGDVIDGVKLVTDSSVIGDVGTLGVDGVGLND